MIFELVFYLGSSKSKRGCDHTPAFNHGCAKSLSLKLSRADKELINLNVEELLKGDYSTHLFQSKLRKVPSDAPTWNTPGKVLRVSPKKSVFQDPSLDLTFRKLKQSTKCNMTNSLASLDGSEIEYMSQKPDGAQCESMFESCLNDETTRLTN